MMRLWEHQVELWLGISLDTVFQLYGTLFKNWKNNGCIVYVYENYDIGFPFWVNPVTNKVVQIRAYILTC